MVERLVVLTSTVSADEALTRVEAADGQIRQAYGTRVWVVEVPPERDADLAIDPAIASAYVDVAPDDDPSLDEVERAGIAAWNLRHSPPFRASRATRIGEGRSWGDSVEPEG